MTGKDPERKEAIRYIENQIRDGYIDLNFLDEVEMDIITCALKQYEQQKWIPCSERLPDSDDIMLVTCKPKKGSPNVNRAYYMDGAWHGSGSMSNVTAWMPLPKPYQEDSK